MSWGTGPPAAERPQAATNRPAPRPAGTVPWAELHCHSSFSFLDGAATPGELVAEAARLGLETRVMSELLSGEARAAGRRLALAGATAGNLRENSACLCVRLCIEFGFERVGEGAIELDRGAAPAALAIKPHQAAHGRLMQRLKPQEPRPDFYRCLGFSARAQLRHQPEQNIDGLILGACCLRPPPGFKFVVLDVEPVQEFAGVEVRRFF